VKRVKRNYPWKKCKERKQPIPPHPPLPPPHPCLQGSCKNEMTSQLNMGNTRKNVGLRPKKEQKM
jgi:hypothetical protein